MTATLYWFSVIGGLSTFLWVLIVLSVIVLLVASFVIAEEAVDELLTIVKYCLSTALICGFLQIFIPSTKELYFIYGVGETIDYIKSNDTARQLPDKAIQALDKWLELDDKEESKQ